MSTLMQIKIKVEKHKKSSTIVLMGATVGGRDASASADGDDKSKI